jgi:hypothetical protein
MIETVALKNLSPWILRMNNLFLHVKQIMDKKLTLSLDQDIIERAKVYAKEHQISLSKLVEAYLSSIVDKSQEVTSITPLVQSLSGLVNIPEDFDYKNKYTDYLLEKYG